MFYILCRNPEERDKLIVFLKSKGIYAVFHYLSLDKSPFYRDKTANHEMKNSDYYTDHLLRLPLYYELSDDDLNYVVENIKAYYRENG